MNIIYLGLFFVLTILITIPIKYRFGRGKFHIVILAGTHGNEPAPSEYLMNYIPHLVEIPDSYRFTIIPKVNPIGLLMGARLSPTGDINRSWSGVNPITLYLKKILSDADLVIDFHEGWGFSNCQSGTLGQTIYSSFGLTKDISQTLSTLNNHLNQSCLKWKYITRVPYFEGSLDEYCRISNIPYILVELAGQNDVVSREVRYEQMQIILHGLAGLQ